MSGPRHPGAPLAGTRPKRRTGPGRGTRIAPCACPSRHKGRRCDPDGAHPDLLGGPPVGLFTKTVILSGLVVLTAALLTTGRAMGLL